MAGPQQPPQAPPGAGPGGPPPTPQAPPGGAPDAGGGSASGLLQTLDKAIDHVNMMVQQSKAVPPEGKQLFASIDDSFGKFMEIMGGGGGDQDDQAPPGQGQGQTVPMQAGGNKGAIPSPV